MQEFIRTRGVTSLPGFGTPEFRELNIEREKERDEQNRRNAGRWVKAKAVRLRRAVRP